jgi:transposase
MRGADIQQDTLFSTVIPEERVPKDHPLRPIRRMVNAALKELDADFNALYSDLGRDSIPPEKLLRAQLLMAFYTIRSERQLMEQIDYNLLFRWFVGFFDG